MSPISSSPRRYPGIQTWTCFNCNEVQQAHADRMNEIVDWYEVTALASSLKGGMSCHIPPHWAMGSRSFVREVHFADRTRWTVKLLMRLQRDPEAKENGLTLLNEEMQAMNFVKNETNIPVATCYGIHTLFTNLGSTTCLFAELIVGINGSNFFHTTKANWGTPKKRRATRKAQRNITKGLASIKVQLACHRSDGEGTLGDMYDTINSPAEYYSEAVRRLQKDFAYYRAQMSDFQEKTFYDDVAKFLVTEQALNACEKVLAMFRAKMPRYAKEDTNLYLTNTDLGPHNVIVTRTGRLKAMIDCDSLSYMPLHDVVQFRGQGLKPSLIGRSAESLSSPREKREFEMVEQFVSDLRGAGVKGDCLDLREKLASACASMGAYLVFGLEVAWYLNESGAEEWIEIVKSCEGLLSAASGALILRESVEDECSPWDETATCNGWADSGETYWPDETTPFNGEWAVRNNSWHDIASPSNWMDKGDACWGGEPAIVDEWAGEGDTCCITEPTTCGERGDNRNTCWPVSTAMEEWAEAKALR